MSSIQVSYRIRTRTGRRCLWAAGLLAVAGGFSGCGRSTGPATPVGPLSADQVLYEMINTYQQATAYQDDAVVRLSYKRDGRDFADEAPLAVSWQRPNQVSVRAYQVEVACDGSRFRAKIRDQSTGDFDGQIVDRDAPSRLLPRQFFEDDEVLSLALRQGLAGNPIQLDLLLSEKPLDVLFEDTVTRQLLQPADIDDHPCYRVAVDSDDGRFVFWIDQENYLLRKMEYPAETFAPEVAQDPDVDDLALTVECRKAALKSEIPLDVFTIKMPRRAKKVTQFIPPPRELPSKLFGTKTRPYSFRDLSGGVVSNVSLKDRIKVFVWFNNHPACQSTVQQLNQVFQQYRDEPRIALFSVCVEPSSFTNQQVEQLVEMWQVEVPVVRDLEALGRDLFQIPWAPTMVILDGENTVQIVEVGANPNLVAELPQVLERLLAGEDLASEILAQSELQQEAYAKALKEGKPLAKIASTSPSNRKLDPQLIELRPLWTNSQLKTPGNILAICDKSGPARFLVHEGWQTVTELNDQGDIIARHKLDLPERAAVSQLQTGVDANGDRYYVAWSLQGRQAHLFDAQWERLLSYPTEPSDSTGVQDVKLTDLDGDGDLEVCVGFWGNGGVHSISLSGKILWTSTGVSHVFSLMETPDGKSSSRLQVALASGAMLSFDHLGRHESTSNNSGQLIHHVFRNQSKEQAEIPYCGISYGPEGRRLAIGLTDDFEPRWRYNLPAGSFPSQVRFVTSAKLLSDEADDWLIAAPDGSLHMISRDGRFTDFFSTGAELLGVAGGRVDSKSVLLVSNSQGVQAWQVIGPTTAKNSGGDSNAR